MLPSLRQTVVIPESDTTVSWYSTGQTRRETETFSKSIYDEKIGPKIGTVANFVQTTAFVGRTELLQWKKGYITSLKDPAIGVGATLFRCVTSLINR